MNNTQVQSVNNIIFGLFLTLVTCGSLTGCGKKNDAKPDESKITMKITVTVSGADNGDQVDFRVIAGNHDASQYGTPVWKLNGTTQGNENVILLDLDNFTGNTRTYVLETVKAFDFGSLAVNFSNLDGTPITVNYKAEINGNIETNVQNVVIAAGQSQNKTFNYAAKK